MLVEGDEVYPIDYANACPDVAVTSLHYYFPWAIAALVRWSVFCLATGRPAQVDLDTSRYFAIADDRPVLRREARRLPRAGRRALRDRALPRLVRRAAAASGRAGLRLGDLGATSTGCWSTRCSDLPAARARAVPGPLPGTARPLGARQRPLTMSIADVVAPMQERLDALPAEYGQQRVFLSTYQRTTRAVGKAIEDGLFEDPAWVEHWDVVFADLYLSALDAELSGRAGAEALATRLYGARGSTAAATCPARHQRAHQLRPAPGTARRDQRRRLLRPGRSNVVAVTTSASTSCCPGGSRPRTRSSARRRSLLDRLLTPVNRLASKRLLREARQKVWHNTMELQAARLAGPTAYAGRLAELELLSAAKIADLLAPGQVLLRLAVGGFGVTLPPPA